jgi:hypothetical protein
MPYLKTNEISETATTSRSSRLNPDLQKAPGWRMKPYDITLRQTSTVKIVVKK